MYIVYREKKVFYTRKKAKGIPTLFLHGWGCDGKSLKALAKDKNAILIDFPPFGKSQSPNHVYTLFDYVNIVLKILEKENVEKVDVIAHSFGGRVALELANMGVVNKLVLMGSAGLKPRFSIKKYIAKIKYKRAKYLVKKGILPESHLDKYGSSDYKTLSPDMKKTFVNIVNFYQNDILKYINCDTLLLWGKEDKETPISYAKTFAKNIKNSAVIYFENSGHFAYLQKNYEHCLIINNFLKDWLWNFFLQLILICT